MDTVLTLCSGVLGAIIGGIAVAIAQRRSLHRALAKRLGGSVDRDQDSAGSTAHAQAGLPPDSELRAAAHVQVGHPPAKRGTPAAVDPVDVPPDDLVPMEPVSRRKVRVRITRRIRPEPQPIDNPFAAD